MRGLGLVAASLIVLLALSLAPVVAAQHAVLLVTVSPNPVYITPGAKRPVTYTFTETNGVGVHVTGRDYVWVLPDGSRLGAASEANDVNVGPFSSASWSDMTLLPNDVAERSQRLASSTVDLIMIFHGLDSNGNSIDPQVTLTVNFGPGQHDGSLRLLPPILLLSVSDNPAGSLTLDMHDAAGNKISPTIVHFFSSNPEVATVSDDGVVTAIRPPQAKEGFPLITAEADGLQTHNDAVVRVTQTSLGLTLDGLWGKHVAFYVPRQGIGGFRYEQIFSDWDAVRITDIVYELEHEGTGVVPFEGDTQFLVNDPGHGADGTVPCGSAGNPIRLGTDVDKPNNSCLIDASGNGSPQWWIFFHEMGHNFLGEGVRIHQFLSGHSKDGAYSEVMASILAMYAAKMLEERSSQYDIPRRTLDKILPIYHYGTMPDLDAYIRNGADYSKVTVEVVYDTINAISYRYGYHIVRRFFSLFLPRDAPFPFTIGSDMEQSTLFVAALSSAAGADLRAQFRQWGFPIDDGYYSSIWNEVSETVNGTERRTTAVSQTETLEGTSVLTQTVTIVGSETQTETVNVLFAPLSVSVALLLVVLVVLAPLAYFIGRRRRRALSAAIRTFVDSR